MSKAKEIVERVTGIAVTGTVTESYDTLANAIDILCNRVKSVGYKELEHTSKYYKKHSPKEWKVLDDAIRLFTGYLT